MIGYYDENPNPEEVEAWKWMAIDDVKVTCKASEIYNMV
jgi:isopentenyl-diphosphate delta-isomerase